LVILEESPKSKEQAVALVELQERVVDPPGGTVDGETEADTVIVGT